MDRKVASNWYKCGCLNLDFGDDHSDLGVSSMQSGVVPTVCLLFVKPQISPNLRFIHSFPPKPTLLSLFTSFLFVIILFRLTHTLDNDPKQCRLCLLTVIIHLIHIPWWDLDMSPLLNKYRWAVSKSKDYSVYS